MIETFALPVQALWRDELWNTVLDVAALVDDQAWTLIGPQAVTAHALAAERGPRAAPLTRDHCGYILTSTEHLPDLELSMRYLGFSLQPGSTAVSRSYRREPDQGSGDRNPQCWSITTGGSDAAEARLADRRVHYRVTKGMRSVSIAVPDLLATVVFEATQFGRDEVDPFSHARAAAFLVALMDDATVRTATPSVSDRRALRVLDASIGFDTHHAWAVPTAGASAFDRWTTLLGSA